MYDCDIPLFSTAGSLFVLVILNELLSEWLAAIVQLALSLCYLADKVCST